MVTRESVLALAEKLSLSTTESTDEDEGVEKLTDMQEYLVSVISNPNNNVVASMNLSSIEETKKNIITDAGFSKTTSAELLKSLREYRYVDELNELREGCYTRWICLNKMNTSKYGNLQPKLTIGGILCEIKPNDVGVSLICKNKKRMFQFNMETSLVFQKLTHQEKILLYAIHAIEN